MDLIAFSAYFHSTHAWISTSFCILLLAEWLSSVAMQGLPEWASRPPGEPKWGKNEKSLSKSRNNWSKFEGNLGKWNFCPPGMMRLATALESNPGERGKSPKIGMLCDLWCAIRLINYLKTFFFLGKILKHYCLRTPQNDIKF